MIGNGTVEDRAQAAFPNIRFYTVYLITTDRGYQYWGILNQGAADMAALIGVNYIWDAPMVRSTSEQIEIIRRAVERGANALLIAADDPKWISRAVEDAKSRGVKVVYVDAPAYEEAITTLSTNNYEAGVIAGQTMISLLNRRGVISGSIGILNLAGKENTFIREIGFRDTIGQDGRFKIAATIYSDSDVPVITESLAQRLISENEDLIALFGTSEGTTLGVGYANLANNNRFISLGFDLTEDSRQLLRQGSLMAIIDQNPYTMGYLGMAQAVAAILGKDTGPKFINTGVEVVEMA